MKRPATMFVMGLLAAALGYGGFYFWGTASERALFSSTSPELAWLKKEFSLGDAEFKRVCDLHAAYRPHCMEMCRRIEAKNRELRELMGKTNRLTAEIEMKLSEAGQLRVECETAMLRHFYQVSQTMPAEQGRRYLEWVQTRTLLANQAMAHQD